MTAPSSGAATGQRGLNLQLFAPVIIPACSIQNTIPALNSTVIPALN